MWVKEFNKVTGVATWSIIPASAKELESKKVSFYTGVATCIYKCDDPYQIC